MKTSWSAITSFILTLVVSPLTISHAGIDLSTSARLRTFPKGGGLETEIGWGTLIWGSESSPLYGFIRLAGVAEGAQNYFAPSAYVEIFPVSILGLRAGQVWAQSHLNYDDYDCTQFECRGAFHESYFEVPLYFKYSNIIISAAHRQGRWEYKDTLDGLHFIEPQSGLPLSKNQNETITQNRGYIFLSFSEKWRLGGFYSQWHVPNETTVAITDRKSQMWLGLLQYIDSKFMGDSEISMALGAGEYQSVLLHSDPTVYVYLNYSPLKKLGY